MSSVQPETEESNVGRPTAAAERRRGKGRRIEAAFASVRGNSDASASTVTGRLHAASSASRAASAAVRRLQPAASAVGRLQPATSPVRRV